MDQESYIERWLNDSCPSPRLSVVGEAQLAEASEAMPRRPSAVLPSPKDSFDKSTSASRKSDRSSASVNDPAYRTSLQHRNIYIHRDDPPHELMRRAKRILSRSRTSPEIDDATVQSLIATTRRVENDSEEVIIQQLAPGLIPAMKKLSDPKLASNADQPWSNSVPVPLKPSILTDPLPLPKPKPDLAFGYSQTSFTENQLGTIELLVDDQFGRSYAVPDQKLRFPFLDIEFKSQAKNGTHYVATNQTANAGAIALYGNVDLIQRSFGMEQFDYDEPRFFSVTMDHELARINVHWIKAPVDGGGYSFHVEGIAKHLLDDASGIRAVIRAIKNILDYGADQRLRTLCTALDAYRETVVRDREAANPHRLRHEAVPEVRDGQGQRSTELILEKGSVTKSRHQLVHQTNSAHEVRVEEQTTRYRHGSSPTRNAETDVSQAGSRSSLRHLAREPGKNTYYIPLKVKPSSRHADAGSREQPRRQIRPTQKLIDSTNNLTAGAAKPRGRHDP